MLMTCSTNGNLWIAMYGASRLMVFSPEGQHLKDIVLSARQPTCPAWGGKNFDTIYMTSAVDQYPDASPDDEGGHLFRYKPVDAHGVPKYEFPA